jgi:hypothetical protein
MGWLDERHFYFYRGMGDLVAKINLGHRLPM